MAQNKTGNSQQEFKIDEAQARALLDRDEAPEIDASWDPRTPGWEPDVYRLVNLASDAGILGASVDFDWGDDGESIYYRYLVNVTPDLTLATATADLRLLGGNTEAWGIDAVIGILNEAAAAATEAIGHLDAYAATRTS